MRIAIIFTAIWPSTASAIEENGFLGLNLPGLQSIGRVADTLGLGASGVLRGMHQQMLDITAPIDDARLLAINRRDAGLQDHLQFMESAYKPIQNIAALAGSGVNRFTSGLDAMASNLLRPVTDTASFLGKLEQQTLDAGANALNLGLISPGSR